MEWRTTFPINYGEVSRLIERPRERMKRAPHSSHQGGGMGVNPWFSQHSQFRVSRQEMSKIMQIGITALVPETKKFRANLQKL